jgi:hypothetical protein
MAFIEVANLESQQLQFPRHDSAGLDFASARGLAQRFGTFLFIYPPRPEPKHERRPCGLGQNHEEAVVLLTLDHDLSGCPKALST